MSVLADKLSGFLSWTNDKLQAYNNIIAVLGILVSAYVAIRVLKMGQRLIEKQDENFLSSILIECGKYYQKAGDIYCGLDNFGKYFNEKCQGGVRGSSNISAVIEVIRKKLEFIKPRYGFEKMDRHYEIFDKYDRLKCRDVRGKLDMRILEADLVKLRSHLQEMGKASLALQEIFNRYPYIFFKNQKKAREIFVEIQSLNNKNEDIMVKKINALTLLTLEELASGGGSSDKSIKKARMEFVAQCRRLGEEFEKAKETLRYSHALSAECKKKYFGIYGGNYFSETYSWK